MIIEINTEDTQPIYEQLRDQIVFGIADKRLAPNEALPSVRRLAADLGIHFHTVNKAYAALQDDGYIVMDRRKGAVVARAAPGGDVFRAKLARRISTFAAQAVCREMDERDFIALCAGCYRSVKGNT